MSSFTVTVCSRGHKIEKAIIFETHRREASIDTFPTAFIFYSPVSFYLYISFSMYS